MTNAPKVPPLVVLAAGLALAWLIDRFVDEGAVTPVWFGWGAGVVGIATLRGQEWVLGDPLVEAVGVNNVLTKSLGSSNPHNVVRATFEGFRNLMDPYTVMQNRGLDQAEA